MFYQISDRHSLVLTSPYLRNVGSFGPDQVATVYVSSNGNCHESDGSISYPGSADFKNYRAGTNNNEGQVISSFLVVAN
ncbi:unnamed protein product [Zymoseptoria tritici ST99CH_3D7]|uniref:Uncharacterized protein n=2 Tax=Zymoseptoria tritici TaxID=1047171 RepID=A0A1X7S9A0_ZYMT9|nr:unnamed protein product [Zymoseptoria tritici ST99CH_3D7]